jgi:sulfate transport system ATP-binding protein
LRRWLRNLHSEIHMTSVFVTHDQEEALEVADRVVVMDQGRIVQTGTPQQVYEHPRTAFVHQFIGESIALPVVIEAGGVRFDGKAIGLDPQGVPDGAARLFVRPYQVTIMPEAGEAPLRGTIKRVHGLGPARRLEIAIGTEARDTTVEVDAPRSLQLDIGQCVGLRPERYRIFPVEGAAADLVRAPAKRHALEPA